MKIKLTRACVVECITYPKGTELDVPDYVGQHLIKRDKAEIPKKKAAKKKAPVNRAISTDDIETK